MDRAMASRLARFATRSLLVVTLITSAITLLASLTPDYGTKYTRYLDYYNEGPVTRAASNVRDVNEAVAYINRTRRSSTKMDTMIAIDEFVRNRFTHTYSRYSLQEDWLAHLAGYVWKDLSNPVDPNHILRETVAGCSQQSIVVQELLKRFGIEYQSIGFERPWHFASAAKIGGTWYVVDTDLYPDNSKPILLSSIITGKKTAELYREPFGSAAAEGGRQGRVWTMHYNNYPAPRAIVFHRLTGFLSRYGFILAWIATVIAYLVEVRLRRKRCDGVASLVPASANSTTA